MQLKRTEENTSFIQGTYTLKLYLTGDLEFLSKMYGLSDARLFAAIHFVDTRLVTRNIRSALATPMTTPR